MNRIAGTITQIHTEGSLSLVTAETKAGECSAIVIDTPDTNALLKTGKPVQLIFKETEVAIGTGPTPSVSLQNRLKGTISQLDHAPLLSKVVIATAAGPVTAIITSKAVAALELDEGKEAVALIKTNEIMLAE